jgi:hypothetical protein
MTEKITRADRLITHASTSESQWSPAASAHCVKVYWRPGDAMSNAAQVPSRCRSGLHCCHHLLQCAWHHDVAKSRGRQALLSIL